jgi:hypothetical protein
MMAARARLLERLPAPFRDALPAVEHLDDLALERVAAEKFPEEQYEQFVTLRERWRNGILTSDEQATLDQLVAKADLLALRKAHAALLLKLRGYRLPTLAELEAR